jgi:cytochrome P450
MEWGSVGGMHMNVRLCSQNGFPIHLTIHVGTFAASKSDIVVLRSLFPAYRPQLLLADATATKVGRVLEVMVFMFKLSVQAILQDRAAFPKVARIMKTSQEVAFGPSILMTEHNEWRKHRRIAGPSFTESNNILVWDSAIGITLGYFIKWNRDGKGDIVKVTNFTHVATQIAYMVFSTAGGYETLSAELAD